MHLGIDLGTTYTLVAGLSEDKEPKLLSYFGDMKMIPSCIYIEEPAGNLLVGKPALDAWANSDYNPANSFLRWKPEMGQNKILRTLQIGRPPRPFPVTPEYLTKCLVEYVINELTKDRGDLKIESILVTVPHGWRRENPDKCRATRNAAAQARTGNRNLTVQQFTVSEPVAAAAYWLWDARKRGLSGELQGKTLLVCDIGGGTLDLSLVRLEGARSPLDVVDAANNYVAGDYVDALLCAWVCGQFNSRFGTRYPTSAEDVLQELAGVKLPWLRGWFLDVRGMKHELSEHFSQVTNRPGSPLKPTRSRTFDDMSGHTLPIRLTLEDFTACAEPFYAAGRALIQEFLTRNRGQLPYAVLMAGGGSRIAGVREHILAPVLRQFYSAEEADKVLDRTPVNRQRTDEAIALGAALIANGIIQVQERLLNQIGMMILLQKELAEKLGVPSNQPVLLIPVLKKGAILPARATNSDLGLLNKMAIISSKQVDLEVVVDDDPNDPMVQRWTLSHPGGGRAQSVQWEMIADQDGVLTLRLQPAQGNTVEVFGRLERTLVERAHVFYGDISGSRPWRANATVRVTPQRLRQLDEELAAERAR